VAKEKISVWTESRIRRIFDRYNDRYWRGRIPRYNVVLGGENPTGPFGFWDPRRKIIRIFPASHKNDAVIRSTLLHEMVHAHLKREARIHGEKFWFEVERLLRKGAPISVTASEAPDVRILAGSIPKRFPLARRAMERVERQRQRGSTNLFVNRTFR